MTSPTNLVNVPIDVVQKILDKVKVTDETNFMKALRSSMRVASPTKEAQIRTFMEAYIAQRYNLSIIFKPTESKRQPKKFAFECDVPISATQKQRLVGELLVTYNFRSDHLKLAIEFEPVRVLDTEYSKLFVSVELLGTHPGFTMYIKGKTQGVVQNGLNMHLFRGLLKVLYFTVLQRTWMKDGKKTIVAAEPYVQAFLKRQVEPVAKVDFGIFKDDRNLLENEITFDARGLPWFDASGKLVPVGGSVEKMKENKYLFNVSGNSSETYDIQVRKLSIYQMKMLYKNNQLEIVVWFKTTPETYKMDIRRFTPTTLGLIAQILHYNLWTQNYRTMDTDAVQRHLGDVKFRLCPRFGDWRKVVID